MQECNERDNSQHNIGTGSASRERYNPQYFIKFYHLLGPRRQCAMRDRGPKNVRRGVQTDAILLRYASADHGTKEMLAVFG